MRSDAKTPWRQAESGAPHRLLALLGWIVLASGGACTVPDDLLEDKACEPASADPTKRCVVGYQCVCATPDKCFCIERGDARTAAAASGLVVPAEDSGAAEEGVESRFSGP